MLNHQAPMATRCVNPPARLDNSPESPAPERCQPATSFSFDAALMVFVAQHGGHPLTERDAAIEAALLIDTRAERMDRIRMTTDET